jgi:hypothetical protein
MDREKYLQMRRTGQYDFAWFYQYFLEHRDRSKAPISFEIFQRSFNMYFQMNGGVLIENMDKKMEVTKIENEQGNLLYIN